MPWSRAWRGWRHPRCQLSVQELEATLSRGGSVFPYRNLGGMLIRRKKELEGSGFEMVIPTQAEVRPRKQVKQGVMKLVESFGAGI